MHIGGSGYRFNTGMMINYSSLLVHRSEKGDAGWCSLTYFIDAKTLVYKPILQQECHIWLAVSDEKLHRRGGFKWSINGKGESIGGNSKRHWSTSNRGCRNISGMAETKKLHETWYSRRLRKISARYFRKLYLLGPQNRTATIGDLAGKLSCNSSLAFWLAR
jgi:hypothetical protein